VEVPVVCVMYCGTISALANAKHLSLRDCTTLLIVMIRVTYTFIFHNTTFRDNENNKSNREQRIYCAVGCTEIMCCK